MVGVSVMQRDTAWVAAVAHRLGVDWHTLFSAIKPLLRQLADDPSRFEGVAVLGVDEHIGHHADLITSGRTSLGTSGRTPTPAFVVQEIAEGVEEPGSPPAYAVVAAFASTMNRPAISDLTVTQPEPKDLAAALASTIARSHAVRRAATNRSTPLGERIVGNDYRSAIRTTEQSPR